MPMFSHGRRDLRAHVARELRSLGRTKDEVAQHLEAAGVRGRPGSMGTCALAVYVSAVIGTDPRAEKVMVGHEHVFITLEGREGCVGVPLPKVLGGFVFDFDRWRYPALIEVPEVPDVRLTRPEVPSTTLLVPVAAHTLRPAGSICRTA